MQKFLTIFQVYPEYPGKKDFYKKCVQVTGFAGDVMIFPGIMQHAAMPNRSNAPRTGVLLQVSAPHVENTATLYQIGSFHKQWTCSI